MRRKTTIHKKSARVWIWNDFLSQIEIVIIIIIIIINLQSSSVLVTV